MQYYWIVYSRKLWLLLLGLLAVYGVIYACSGNSIRLSDLASHRYRLFKGKVPLYYVMAVLLIVNIYVNAQALPLTGKATISFNYDGASHGLNPNSTRFNQADMLSDPVLERVINLGRLKNISVSDLREVIEVVPVDKGIGSDGNYRVSTEYSAQYKANAKFAGQDGEAILELFCGSYKEWFTAQYACNLASLDFDFASIKQEDYLDMCDYFDTLADRISNYMKTMSRKAPNFRPATINETFDTLSTKAANAKGSVIQNLRAYILGTGISKDSATYTSRLTVENVMLTFDSLRYAKSNENRLAAIQKYENDMARIVLVPTYDMDGQFYMSQTKIGVDSFAEQAEDFAKQKTSVNADIAANNYIFDRLNGAVPSPLSVQKAEQLVQAVEEELTSVSNLAKAALREYDEKQTNGYLSVHVEATDDKIREMLKDAVLKTFILYCAALAVMFITEIKREKSRRGVMRDEKLPDFSVSKTVDAADRPVFHRDDGRG